MSYLLPHSPPLDGPPRQVPLRHYLVILRRYRIMIAATVIAAVVLAVAFSAVTPTRYTAVAEVSFNDQSADLQALGTAAAPSQAPDKVAAAQATIIRSSDIAQRVKMQLNLTDSIATIQRAIHTDVQPANNLVAIRVTWRSARQAAYLANALAAQSRATVTNETRGRYEIGAKGLQERIAKLDPNNVNDRITIASATDQATRLLSLAQFTRPVDIASAATVPSAPSAPKPVRNVILAMLLGLVIAIAVAFVRQAIDRRLRDLADVREIVADPILSQVDATTLGRGPVERGRLAALSDLELEPFRIMRTSLDFLAIGESAKSVLVTSPLPEEGKSTVSMALAQAEALAGRRTLLVDCDMRKPSVSGRLGLPAGPGLSDLLAERATLSDVTRSVIVSTPGRLATDMCAELVCIPAGSAVPNPAELLGSGRFARFLAEVSAEYDQVIVDSPPLLPVGDTMEMIPSAGAVLLCIRVGQTTRDQAVNARAVISRLPSRPLGIVVTGVDARRDADATGSYAYSYSYPVAEPVS